MPEKLLITGSDGYVGTLLCRRLGRDFDVTGYDAGYYRDSYLYAPAWDLPETITGDVRDVARADVRGFAAVICLSDLNDPLSQAYPDVTRDVNYSGLAQLAECCKDAGVPRFVYASSASVYGRAGPDPVTEDSPLRPLTPYAECKARMEEHLLALADDDFSVTCLRNATVYGLSPRMRFDLVANFLCGSAVAEGVVELKSDGSAWRPFVHVEDVCDAFAEILAMSPRATNGLVVNVGDGRSGNHRVLDVAQIVAEATGHAVVTDDSFVDDRSYLISSARLNALGVRCTRDLAAELRAMIGRLEQLQVTSEVLRGRACSRIEQIRHLLATGQVDRDLARVPL